MKNLEPKDDRNAVYMIQFLYGLSMLLPFNTIISSLDFF